MKKKIAFVMALIMLCLSVPVNVSAGGGQGDYQTTAAVKIYSRPSTLSSIVTTVPKGDVITKSQVYGNWYAVYYLGKAGFVKQSNLKELGSSYKRNTKAAGTLKETFSYTAKTVIKVPKGATVAVYTTSGDWSFCSYFNMGLYYGWIKTSNLTTAASKTAATSKTVTEMSSTVTATKITSPHISIDMTATSSSVPSYMEYLVYNAKAVTNLNTRQKAFMKALLSALKTGANKDYINMGNSWKISNAEANEIKKTFAELYFPFDGEIRFSYQPTDVGMQWRLYSGSSSTWVKTNNTYIQKCKNIVSPYVKSGMTTRQKVIAIDKAICNFMTYSYSNYDVKTAIRTGRGACGCYAKIFQAACIAYQIPCKYIVGTAYSFGSWGKHAWNRVLVGSTWYYIDSTWNDTSNSNKCTLSTGLWSDHRL